MQLTSSETSSETVKENAETPEPSTEEPTVILCELVGASDLKPEEDADGNEFADMQPYCVVKFGDVVIHRSKESSEVGVSPIWTVETKSLFLLFPSTEDIKRKKLTITLWNKHRNDGPLISSFVSDATFLGRVQLDLATVVSHCDEERFEVPLRQDSFDLDESNGALALRFRLATEADIKFVTSRNKVHEDQTSTMSREAKKVMQALLNNEEDEQQTHETFLNITEKDETEVAGSTLLNTLSYLFSSNGFTERGTGIHMIRVKPGPDPMRPKETEYLTRTDIKTETLKPSRNWVESGSGKLGTLHLEILSCHDLPNVGES